MLLHPATTASLNATATPGQLSVAVATPVELESVVSPQLNVTAGGQVIVGGWLSLTDTVNVQVDV